ncbi:MAG: glycosylase [Bacteroidetes bacterium]|nr:MAG: glycosylase [Bacteroidota bacterium]
MKKYLIVFSILFVTKSIVFAQEATKPPVPEWIHQAVFYEIYPQTFKDSDGDGIGDIKGIIEKLDYVKSLGVNAIWFNPFYESPYRDAGYDVSDYYKVGARYGTNADAKLLFDEIHKRGMKVIIDFVPGHTSADHPWFQESAKQEKNKYSNWYIWTNATWDNGGSEFAGKMINGYGTRFGSYMTNFFYHQPALNFGFAKPDSAKPWQLPTNNPDVLALRAEMKNILKFWLEMGSDGFRVDMAGSLVKNDNDELKACAKWWLEVREFIQKIKPEAFTVAEWSYPKHALVGGFHADYLHWISSYENLFRKETWRSLNGVSPDGNSYFDKNGKGDISAFIKDYLDQYNATKDKGYISIPVGNHDLTRINIDRSQSELEMIFAFSFAIPGVPFVYYGDEIGMKQLYNLPYIEGCYGGRAGARTPMQWNDTKNNGFSTAPYAKLWMPTDTSKAAVNVASQEKNPSSMLSSIKKLIALRRTEKALAGYADFKVLYAEKDKYPFVFARTNGNEQIVVAINPSCKEVSVEIPNLFTKKTIKLIGTEVSYLPTKTATKLTLKAGSYAIYKTAK